MLDVTRQKFAAAPAKHPYVLAWDDGDKKDTHKSAEHIAIPLPLLLQHTSPQQSLSTDQEQNSTANTYWQERDELQLQLASEKETCQQLQQQEQQQEKQIDARSMTLWQSQERAQHLFGRYEQIMLASDKGGVPAAAAEKGASTQVSEGFSEKLGFSGKHPRTVGFSGKAFSAAGASLQEM